MVLDVYIHLCPLCRKPIAIRDIFRDCIEFLDRDYVEYRFKKQVFDKAAGLAEITCYLFLHRKCHDEIIQGLNSVAGRAGKIIFAAPAVTVFRTEQERIIIGVADPRALVELLRSAHLVFLDKITLELPEDIERKCGGRRPLNEVLDELVSLCGDTTVRDAVKEAIKKMGEDPDTGIVRAERDLVEHGQTVVHLILVTAAGIVRLLVPIWLLAHEARDIQPKII